MERSPYLIIGGSNAALGAIAAIRAADPDGAITLLARETEGVYSRPLITHWLAGRVDELPATYWTRGSVAVHHPGER